MGRLARAQTGRINREPLPGGAEVRTWRSDSHMADNKSPNAILVLTYALLLVTAAWVAARFVAWQHEG